MRWPEFDSLISGLLAADTRLHRHFFPPKRDPNEPDEEG